MTELPVRHGDEIFWIQPNSAVRRRTGWLSALQKRRWRCGNHCGRLETKTPISISVAYDDDNDGSDKDDDLESLAFEYYTILSLI